MTTLNRRAFLTQTGAASAIAARAEGLAVTGENPAEAPPVDFRYAPRSWQTAFCLPDDPYKSLAGDRGELRCGHPGTNSSIQQFSSVVEFSVCGLEPDTVERQELEAPGVPIVHTFIDRPSAKLELIAFATNRAGEGRVDNVILHVRSKVPGERRVSARILINTGEPLEASVQGSRTLIQKSGSLFMAASCPMSAESTGRGSDFFGAATAFNASGARFVFRFPQERQPAERILAGIAEPDALLAEARAYWRDWHPFGRDIAWQFPRPYQDFLTACTRNILQAREVKQGRKTFQVGPTVYRNLWIVDGNFILEAARYLGYDDDARQGLEATWTKQQANGSVVAAVEGKHWKDTAIAMFTLSRQAELSQDWSYFRQMTPNLLRAAAFLESVRDQAKSEDSANGRYGLLARAFGDGGLNGVRSEFTNTVWSLAGLRATVAGASRAGANEFAPVARFHDELRTAFFAAARKEMVKHPAGFEYLPMLMREDEAWRTPDPWNRPKAQNAQWALSHSIYPGLVFEKSDPVVEGHIALMQACSQEDVPAETGWLAHEGLWTYNAPFAAQVYLWRGLKAAASRAFHGFLNHASPLYCWREEQPLRNSLVARYWGDMPHNWASAECVRYLRHMVILEDGEFLRVIDGITDSELSTGAPFVMEHTPTRFGHVSVRLEPERSGREWVCHFRRESGHAPAGVQVPARLGRSLELQSIEGAQVRKSAASWEIDPAVSEWSGRWVSKA